MREIINAVFVVAVSLCVLFTVYLMIEDWYIRRKFEREMKKGKFEDLGFDAWFIQSRTDRNSYIHPNGTDSAGHPRYEIKRGITGAAIFTNKNAKTFIRVTNLQGVDIVKAKPIIKNPILLNR